MTNLLSDLHRPPSSHARETPPPAGALAFTYSDDSTSLRQTFRVGSDSVGGFINWALGLSRLQGTSPNVFVARRPPCAYADLFHLGEPVETPDGYVFSPHLQELFAVAARVTTSEHSRPESGDLLDTGVNISADVACHVELEFGPLHYVHVRGSFPDAVLDDLEPEDDNGNPADVAHYARFNETYLYRYVSRHLGGVGEAVKLPFGKTYKVGEPGPEVAFVGRQKVLPIFDRVYTWHDVPAIHMGAPWTLRHHASFIGCVNSDTFDGMPPGTLLLSSAEAVPSFSCEGEPLCNIIYRMQHLDRLDDEGRVTGRGHNSHWKWDGASYSYVDYSADGLPTGRKRCDSRRFAELFWFPNPLVEQ